MTDLDTILKNLKSNTPPTLKDRIRERMQAIEEARANGVKWKVILHTLETAGIVIDLQLLASYVCQIRRETRLRASEQMGDLPVGPAPSLQAKTALKQVNGGTNELPRYVAGGLLAAPLLQ